MKSQLDLNLLKGLTLLDKYRQLKPVAKELGKTESAVSKHLAKLREQLGDPLFVRGAHEYEPTEFALQLLPVVRQGLELIDGAVQKEYFNPLTYDEPIYIALPAVAQFLIGSELLIDLITTFPNAEINITSWDDNSVQDIVEGNIDLGVQYFNSEVNKVIYQCHLGKCEGAILCSSKYAERTIEEKLKMPFVTMEMKGWQEKKAAIKLALENNGFRINKIATVDNMTCLFEVLDRLECTTFMPLLKSFEKRPDINVTVLPQCLELEQLPSIVAYLKLVNQSSPLHQLLISKIKQHLF
ncbi:MAG: LysR family transcriptional regulator [Vibrionaceae bacterium]|nr:LysR family transcriptional regulator [Vibrionaceae bacterium]